jgi:hemerythrin superfamily protein
MSSDAISLLKQDHKAVEGLFRKFESAGPRAFATKRQLVDRVTRELSIHSQLEEQIFYPAVRAMIEQTENLVLESLEEHHLVKLMLAELGSLDPKDERFTAKVTVLIENVRHHVKEEEQDLFPKVRKAIARTDLVDLAGKMEVARKSVSDRPHPTMPDEPPGNLVAGLSISIVDRAMDIVSDAKDKVASMVRELAP